MLRLKTNAVDLASCQLAAILAKMSFPQHVFTAANLGVAVETSWAKHKVLHASNQFVAANTLTLGDNIF